MAAASRAAGETSPQRLKDVVSGRQKCPADLIARLAVVGVDISYVLTGQRPAAAELTPDETALLDNYRHSGPEHQQNISKVSEAMVALYKVENE